MVSSSVPSFLSCFTPFRPFMNVEMQQNKVTFPVYCKRGNSWTSCLLFLPCRRLCWWNSWFLPWWWVRRILSEKQSRNNVPLLSFRVFRQGHITEQKLESTARTTYSCLTFGKYISRTRKENYAKVPNLVFRKHDISPLLLFRS